MGDRGTHHTSSSDLISGHPLAIGETVCDTLERFSIVTVREFFAFKIHYRVSNSGVIPLSTINVTEMQQTVKAIFARSEV